MNKGKFGCPVCNIEFGDLKTWEIHVAGKKHQYNQHRAEVLRKREENGLFIAGFPQKIRSENLQTFLERFGEIIDFYHNVDKRFVLATYREKSVADSLLNNERGVFFNGRRLKINRRRPLMTPAHQPAATTAVTATAAASPASQKEPTLPGIDNKRVSAVLTSGGSLGSLLRELEASPEEKALYEHVLGDLKTLFEIRFPKVNVHPFGSTRTGLNVKGSDIDVYVEILEPESPASNELSALPKPEKLVRIGQKLMLQNSNYFRRVRAITRAKTPIVKFVHRPTQVCCDVSFQNMLGVANSQLIQHYLTLDSRVYPYLMIIKYWARKHEFSGCGKMSNYALVTIAVYYLQQLDPPVLPTVQHLQELCKEEKRVDGWLCSFSADPKAIEASKNKSSLCELLAGFFKFYRDFDIHNMVLCTLSATTIPKVLFLQPENLPETIKAQYLNIPEGKLGLRISTDMVVQDPFELTHNLTASMGSKALKAFLAHCDLAVAIFAEVLKHPEEKRIAFLNDLFNKKPMTQVETKGTYYCISNAEMTLTYLAEETLSIGYLIGNTEDVATSELTPAVIFERWVGLVYKLVIGFFDKILKLSVREDPPEQTAAKVQKVGAPSDVHVPTNNAQLTDTHTLHCKGSYRLWEGRRKVQKGLTIPSNMDCLKIEEMVSEVMHAACLHKGLPAEPIVSFQCDFQPVKEPPSINFTFKDTGCQSKVFMNIMMFLRTRLPSLLNKYMKFLKHQTRTRQTNDLTAEGSTSSEAKISKA
ncbi:hypothetical protein R5R35_009692 [Gryllus longicercus]|uniref:Speckle targeted PIP5K1A-regulated poly(A) polymerase n=1 Tax=Gryllus longicercus TaxID=2509291 RepID=A0AAN9Z5A2_9ORTH